MSNDIVQYKPALAGKRQRTTPEEVIVILAPMFAIFGVEEKAIQRIYVERLVDIPAERLQVAVDTAMDTCKFRPTIAELRELAQGNSEPGPRSDLSQEQIAARPAWWQGGRLYRETDAERRELLRRTEKWGDRYGH